MKCPSCGGNKLRFDIPSQSLFCKHCGQYHDVESYKENVNAEYKANVFQVNVFVCPDCGAELASLDEEITAYCAYCGGQAVLKEKRLYEKPKYIIPFQKTSWEANYAYNEYIKNKWFVPSDMKNTNDPTKFTGIYIPHWSYDVLVSGTTETLTGKRNSDGGKVPKTHPEYEEKLDVTVEFKSDISDVVFDASKAFEDSIAYEISPYDVRKAKEFKEGYFAGFVADRDTESSKTYRDQVEQEAKEKIETRVREVSKTPLVSSFSLKAEDINRPISSNLAFLPVWFMTRRNKDSVSYAVINGQTGKVTADVPIDKKKFFGTAMLIALAIFAFLYFVFPNISVKTLLTGADIALPISSFILMLELVSVRYKKTNQLSDVSTSLYHGLFLFVGLYILMPILVIVLKNKEIFNTPIYELIPLFIAIVNLAAQFLTLMFVIKITTFFPQKIATVSTTITTIVTVLCLLIIAVNLDTESLWYMGCLACVIGVLCNCGSAIYYFNDLSSRPVPNFFNRRST